MKIRNIVILNLLTLAVTLTPTAFAAEASNSSQPSKINETHFFLEAPIHDTYVISSDFGLQINPETKESKGHNGLDYATAKGTAIFAANDGVILFAQSLKGFGETIIIKHNSEFSTLYGHILLGSFLVKAGDTVKKGQKIAEVGSSETGDMLHFSVIKQGTPVNPTHYLPQSTQ
ncbi:M23 family metallopeptidase [Brevibacillus sp. HB1.2]|uniref:M23 family metallopeptidase n=1 Tax=Brevibacillus TaxID=55080 RepID=UPI0003709735|nr:MULTISPECIES: M23 family metallopeptidase [unclassified Brevibacillus]ATF12286.1 M23 family peptidase [Brevibacillus brevis X23]NRS16529.1 M23 family metallopeptidase [Brevibacillus sp. HB1.4B]NTU20572.1 M23 family metallopeptidase [Brevibacillus sp. HB1.2]NTU34245.1 M23 family metallopeptidase [Brevibacillus sp. HB1.1]